MCFLTVRRPSDLTRSSFLTWNFIFNTFMLVCTEKSPQVFEMVINILPGRPAQIHTEVTTQKPTRAGVIHSAFQEPSNTSAGLHPSTTAHTFCAFKLLAFSCLAWLTSAARFCPELWTKGLSPHLRQGNPAFPDKVTQTRYLEAPSWHLWESALTNSLSDSPDTLQTSGSAQVWRWIFHSTD